MNSKEKKILILGAGHSQMPLISMAKKLQYYLVICSYDEKEPGAAIADEFHRISTTDKEAILELAKDKNVDYVLSYGSDITAPTVAFVAEELGLPGNPYRTVQMMADKSLFRAFLKKHGFNVPNFISLSKSEIDQYQAVNLNRPLYIKPVDSSGGRGIHKVIHTNEIHSAIYDALSYSTKQAIIIEEAIETDYNQVHGNGFVVNGELVFSYLGDHHYTSENDVVPVATSWPSRIPRYQVSRIEKEVNRFLKISGYKFGIINIEARIGENDNIYLMELAPRSAVNYVYELTMDGTGVDLLQNLFYVLEEKKINTEKIKSLYVAYYLLHSKIDGLLKKAEMKSTLDEFIKKVKWTKKAGDNVCKYQKMTDSIGVALLNFESEDIMLNTIRNMNDFISIEVE